MPYDEWYDDDTREAATARVLERRATKPGDRNVLTVVADEFGIPQQTLRAWVEEAAPEPEKPARKPRPKFSQVVTTRIEPAPAPEADHDPESDIQADPDAKPDAAAEPQVEPQVEPEPERMGKRSSSRSRSRSRAPLTQPPSRTSPPDPHLLPGPPSPHLLGRPAPARSLPSRRRSPRSVPATACSRRPCASCSTPDRSRRTAEVTVR